MYLTAVEKLRGTAWRRCLVALPKSEGGELYACSATRTSGHDQLLPSPEARDAPSLLGAGLQGNPEVAVSRKVDRRVRWSRATSREGRERRETTDAGVRLPVPPIPAASPDSLQPIGSRTVLGSIRPGWRRPRPAVERSEPMVTQSGVPEHDLMDALVDLVANARLPQDPGLRNAVMGVASAALDATEGAVSKEKPDSDGDGIQGASGRN